MGAVVMWDRAAARTRAEALPLDLAADPIDGGGGVVWFTDTVADPSDPTGQTPMPELVEVARFVRLSDAEAFAHLRSDLLAALDAIDRVHVLANQLAHSQVSTRRTLVPFILRALDGEQ